MRKKALAVLVGIAFLVGCSGDPPQLERSSTNGSAGPDRGNANGEGKTTDWLKPTREPILPYNHVPDSALDRYCHRIDSLYRLRHFDLIADAANELLSLVEVNPEALDLASKRNAQQAITRIAEALRRTGRVEGSAQFITSTLKTWSDRWPDEDSLFSEQMLIRAGNMVTLRLKEHAVADFDTAIARMVRAGYMNRAGGLARQAGIGAFELQLTDLARQQFHRAIRSHWSDAHPDTSRIVGVTLNLLLVDEDSADHHVRAVAPLIDHVTIPRVRSMYFSWIARLNARRKDISGAVIAHLQEIGAYDALDTLTVEEQMSMAIGLHNFAFTLYNVDRVEEALYYMQGAVEINEMLAEDTDPDVARSAKGRLVTNVEFLRTEVMPQGSDRATLPTDRLWLKRPVDYSIDPRPYTRTLKNRAGDYYHTGAEGLDSLVAITRRLEKTGEFGTAVQYFMGAWFAQTNQPDSAVERVQHGMRMKTRDGRFDLARCRDASIKPTTWNAKETGIFSEILEMLVERHDEPRYRQYLVELSELEQRLIDSLFVQENEAIPSLIRSRKEMNNRMIRMLHTEYSRRPNAEVINELVARIDDSKAMLLRKDRFLSRKAGSIALIQAIAHTRTQLEDEQRDKHKVTDALLLHRIDSLEKVLTMLPTTEDLPSRADTGLLSALRLTLDTGTVVLDHLMTDRDVFTSLITRDTVAVIRTARDSTFTGALARVLASLSSEDHGARLSDGDLTVLGIALIPIAVLARRVNDLVIVPDGDLCYLPFEILMVPNSTSDPATPPSRLLDLMNVRYAFSASILAEGVPAGKDHIDPKVLGVAPLYRGDHPASARSGGDQRRRGFANLKNNDAEVEGISSITPTEALLGADADEASFKRAYPASDVLHLAMHAFADPDDPLRSGLVFAQGVENEGWQFALLGIAKEDAEGEDGVLHAYEINSGSMQARLVVLSACETGTGLWRSGDGVRSLARSFYEAGVGSVVSSLWKVDDRATKEIMVKFYEKLAEGMGKADALAEAKRWYRTVKKPGAPASEWAAFILIGDNEPVHLKKRNRTWPWFIGGGALLLLGAVFGRRVRRQRAAA